MSPAALRDKLQRLGWRVAEPDGVTDPSGSWYRGEAVCFRSYQPGRGRIEVVALTPTEMRRILTGAPGAVDWSTAGWT